MISWTKRARMAVRTVTVVVLAAASLAAQAGERKVSIDEVPAAVKRAILQQVGKGRLVDIGVYKKDGKTVYEIEMVVGGKEYDVLFARDGKTLHKSFEGVKAEQTKKRAEEEDENEDEEENEDREEGKGEGEGKGRGEGKAAPFQDDFFLEDRKLTANGRNRYFILEPGYRLVLAGTEGKHEVRLTITVLAETKQVGGVTTRVVEEREAVDGQLVEVSRNFVAMCSQTKSVFYFGEEVDEYRNGKLVGHGGSWLHGKGGARAGMMMPGEPVLGASYYQEVSPGVAMDRARIAATNVTFATPAGLFKGCLKVEEENPLDKEKEFKIHAPGIGLVQDENLVLVEHGFVKTNR